MRGASCDYARLRRSARQTANASTAKKRIPNLAGELCVVYICRHAFSRCEMTSDRMMISKVPDGLDNHLEHPQHESDEDLALVGWLFRAYVGTSEIHEVERADHTRGAALVMVNERVDVPRPLHFAGLRLLLVPPEVWKQALSGNASIPDEFRATPIRSWTRLEQHDDATAYIERVIFENFRCFERADISFGAGMNVLIGQNGAGKTTVLDGIAMELLHIPLVLQNELGKIYFAEIVPQHDVRVARIDKGDTTTFEPQYPASVQVMTHIHGSRIECSSVIKEVRGKKTRGGSGEGVPSFDVRDIVRCAVQEGFDVTLPLIAYYGTARTWRGAKADDGKNHGELSRLAGYNDCLEPSTNLSRMRAWFRRMELLALQDNRAPAVLEASKRALLECLDGFDLVRYDARLDNLAARSKTTGLFLAFDQLSDGQKNMLGMVADMAYRAATLNPHLGVEAATKTPGIVLIDELELHLHPAWQRRIAGDLQRAFPRVQFIATTHSPQVLSSVSQDAILVLEDHRLYRPPAPTRGRDTNSLLAEVFGTSVRPAETAAELAEITRLLDDHKYDDVRNRLDRLADLLTERDPDIGRLRNMLDIVEGFDEAHPEGD